LSYHQLAHELHVRFPGDESFYWPPGTALVLLGGYSVLGESIIVARAITLLVGVATVVLVSLLARLVTRSERAQRFTWILATFYPPAVMLTPQCYSQHFAALFLLAVAYFGGRALQEGRILWSALAGLALGAGCLTRPSMLALVPIVVLVYIMKGWQSP